jgi:hypothetical protein
MSESNNLLKNQGKTIDLLKQIGYTVGVSNTAAVRIRKESLLFMVTPWRETPAAFGCLTLRLN